tara:strand:- start:299 stop:511 length:213 start_codon:yes stop_codon:yes gene_type:complete
MTKTMEKFTIYTYTDSTIKNGALEELEHIIRQNAVELELIEIQTDNHKIKDITEMFAIAKEYRSKGKLNK